MPNPKSALFDMLRNSLAEMTGSDVRNPSEGMVDLTTIAERGPKMSFPDLLRLLTVGPMAVPAMTSKTLRDVIRVTPNMYGKLPPMRFPEQPAFSAYTDRYFNPDVDPATGADARANMLRDPEIAAQIMNLLRRKEEIKYPPIGYTMEWDNARSK